MKRVVIIFVILIAGAGDFWLGLPRPADGSQLNGKLGYVDHQGRSCSMANAQQIEPLPTRLSRDCLSPTDPSPSAYLRSASQTLKARDEARARDLLEKAETRLLTRSVPASRAGSPDSSPLIISINGALHALAMHDFATAEQDTMHAIDLLKESHQFGTRSRMNRQNTVFPTVRAP